MPRLNVYAETWPLARTFTISRGSRTEAHVGVAELEEDGIRGRGEGVPVPVRICFDELPPEHRPLSGTAPFSSTWKVDRGDSKFIEAVVERWRRQQR